jgi:hypothetical protein
MTHRLVLACSFLVLSAVPFPVSLASFGRTNPMEAWPTVLFVVLGLLGLTVTTFRPVPHAFVAFYAWALVRVLLGGFDNRATWCLLVLVAGIGVFRLMAELPAGHDVVLGITIAGVVALQVALGILDVMKINPWIAVTYPDMVGKPHGLLYHPNHYGLYLALALPVLIVLTGHACRLMAGWRRWGTIAAGSFVVSAVITLLIASGSRIALGGLVIVLAWAVSMAGRALARLVPDDRRWTWAACSVFAAALAVVIWRFVGRQQIDSLGGRTPMWTVGAVELSTWTWPSFLFGGGFGSWATWATHPGGRLRGLGVPELGIPPQNAFSGWWTEAHNIGMQVTFEIGIVGLLLGAWVVWALIRLVGGGFAGKRHHFLVQLKNDSAWTVSDTIAATRTSAFTLWPEAWAIVLLIGLMAMHFTLVFHHAALAVVTITAAARLWARR